MQQRAEAAEITVERERGLHRRELRRRAKELADMQEELVQVTAASSLFSTLMSAALTAVGFNNSRSSTLTFD